tara:strand:- start:361 stop:489 length:129 start_codon:yes stop_codon:yes gene_type:complete
MTGSGIFEQVFNFVDLPFPIPQMVVRIDNGQVGFGDVFSYLS